MHHGICYVNPNVEFMAQDLNQISQSGYEMSTPPKGATCIQDPKELE